ncbi:osteopetrosis-associated transmembrane protein 1-like [Pollicipes pollicipes]|uniref:osteopetrosis-associated transmembrane protein 1-like n=1 Tax=Pollicipes pollicipes TaxID=41117 RepID=UPI001884E0E2|nr:osteopetrosis-associated transmembrane protein 1-like [Pollicipes pollicipes]
MEPAFAAATAREFGPESAPESAPEPVPEPAPAITWFDIYQRVMTVVTYVVYAGIIVFVLVILAWPTPQRPRPDGRRPISRREWTAKSLAAKRRGALSPPCRVLLTSFADAFADFMSCSMKSSRPLRVCLKCIDTRYAIEKAYGNILHGTSPADEDCHYELMNQDDVQVVAFNMRYYHRIMDLNRCDRCMLRQPYGGYRVHDEVLDYKLKHDEFRACLRANDHRTAPGADGTPEVCTLCSEHLVRQSNQLEVVAEQPLHPVVSSCKDVEDMANAEGR